MLVFVDDLLIIGDEIQNITFLKQNLHAAFNIQELGLARYLLGIELARSPIGIILN